MRTSFGVGFIFSLVAVASLATSSSGDKVKFDLYYESMCGDCEAYMVSAVNMAFGHGLLEIADFDIHPFGNASEKQVDGKWEFTCQHGPDECAGNMFEACLIHVVQDFKTFWPIIMCLEETGNPVKYASSCAKSLPFDFTEVYKCYNSDLAIELEHGYALETEALNPPHTSVPWVTINGVHTDSIQYQAENDLIKLICDSYTGTKVLDACSHYHLREEQTQTGKCYRDWTF
mmetsp:Transcript_44876/g.51575  ORF Transcript_44876/g.51575 Transcript_44876/m.51575 type:complete len:231 (+) Transcript_44876:34-726(+)